MFESVVDAAEMPTPLRDEDWFDPAWLDDAPWPERVPEPQDIGQIPAAGCAPSGWSALELDYATVNPVRLSDAELIDSIVGFDRLASWASARQARLLAEFARRRPEDHPLAVRSDVPCRGSHFAADEIALALRLSRPAAAHRLDTARALTEHLPATLAAWETGRIDERKARAISETCGVLAPAHYPALQARVLDRAGSQTLSQLRAALARAVLALDPEGAAERHARRRQERRVVLSPEEDGMASLWALLSAPDATAAYHRLGELARELGANDPRGMDARRADLLVDLLTGRRCTCTSDDTTSECTAGECTTSNDCSRTSNDPCEGTHPDGSTPPGTDTDDPTPAGPGSAGPTPAGPTPAGPGSAGSRPNSPRPDCPAGRTRPTPPRRAAPGKPLISVIVPVTTLMGLDDHPGELVGYGPIPAPLAREIAADGTWRRLLTDPESGTLLDHGRTTYTPPAALADFVRARDVYCRNPICNHRATTADLDHTIPYPDGPTSANNLYAACRHDHLVKTFGSGWSVTQDPDEHITWTTPTGHTYTSHPHDYRPDPHPPGDTATTTGPGHDPPEDDPPPF